MDILINIMIRIWMFFTSISFPITFQGVTYNITLYGLFIFTIVVSMVAILIAKAFS